MLVYFTDSDTDFTPVDAKKYGYKLISMPYIFNGVEVKPYVDFEEFDSKKYYDSLRKGTIPTTCAINVEIYKEYFEPEFQKGNDILYVHFSTAMSASFDAMKIAIDELKEKYPERKFYEIDTKGITICSYIVVREVGELIKAGKNIDEIMDWANKNVDKFATYFFADDLKFFRKSGRVSNFSGFMGNLVGVKPIIYMNDEGKMVSLTKVKGTKGAISKLVEYVDELQEDIYNHTIIIGHSDALKNAELLGAQLKEKYGEQLKIEYVVVNPTAGAHCGPDGVGVAFYAKHK